MAQDHPRTRGTNLFRKIQPVAYTGSSPHTRDKLNDKAELTAENRIIPAHAGQIQHSPKENGFSWDHPRTRGTNLDML